MISPKKSLPGPRLRSLHLLIALFAVFLINDSAGSAQSIPGLSSDAILNHLNAAIDWYRSATTKVQPVGLPSDTIYQSNVQSTAVQALQLAFQSAKAEAALVPASQAGESNASSSPQRVSQMLQAENARVTALESQLAAINQKMTEASKRNREKLAAQRDGVAGMLGLSKATQQALQQTVAYASAEGHASGLEGSIVKLESSVPEVTGKQLAVPKQADAKPSIGNRRGLFGNMLAIYDLLEGMHQIDLLIDQTDRVRATAVSLRTPLRAALRSTIQQGEQLEQQLSQSQGQSEVSNLPAQPAATREQFDALTARFKQLAAASIPLAQEIALLDQSRSSLTEWHDSIGRESAKLLRSVLLHVALVALAIGIVLLLSEVWRRVTFRYIHDARRRRQFLLIRRVVVSFCMGIVLILGFVSEFSSLATFAGFVTAGLAVGLQTVLLSVAAYFLLAGRWGLRVGDRISVGGVTGEVIDSGLVRFYLMELAGAGMDLYPTGRVAVFSNSVLFQPTTPLFKQLPGTEYVWHETAVTLQPGANHTLVEENLFEAVNSVYKNYRDDFERQQNNLARRIDLSMEAPEPHAQIHSTDAGLEYVVRYPVKLREEAKTDSEVMSKLLDLIERQPALKAALSSPPKIRAAAKS